MPHLLEALVLTNISPDGVKKMLYDVLDPTYLATPPNNLLKLFLGGAASLIVT